ncbi:hypothetical protein M378DRAFT_157467 [Amanita muscaria Koide BX008]|uniref:Uncharacterized protein n=1 Tax=Amanita muscaria (strain Koide BX008) TaxID=946122 RepID=A0A0C2XIC3_AMAMK|nr:hypothetical protein M378DRAFT_157467 [Amanita muscaria Koide BX008]
MKGCYSYGIPGRVDGIVGPGSNHVEVYHPIKHAGTLKSQSFVGDLSGVGSLVFQANNRKKFVWLWNRELG